MKKNTIMRIAAVLMVLALATTCAISGTFAKYVTKVEGEDSARVAKWGIVLTLNAGEAFAAEYDQSVDNGDYAGLAVKADEKVVAPGTNSEEAEADLQGTVFGTPEVATRYTLKITGLKDVVLPAGTYTDYTELCDADGDGEYGYEKTFTLDKAYTPVKWNFGVSNENGTSYDLVGVAASLGKTFDGFSFTDAETIMDTQRYMDALMPILEGMVSGASNAQYSIDVDAGEITVSMDFEPGCEMDYTFTLSWAWAFEGNDQADTFLGNVAAGVETLPEGASIEIAATVEATATQID